jgi:hypothetical protein
VQVEEAIRTRRSIKAYARRPVGPPPRAVARAYVSYLDR